MSAHPRPLLAFHARPDLARAARTNRPQAIRNAPTKAGKMGKERARQMAIAVLTSGSACDLLAHNREYRLRPPAVALYHTLELGASVRRHAEPIDYDVTDLVLAVACAHAPIDLKRLAVPRPRAGCGRHLAGD